MAAAAQAEARLSSLAERSTSVARQSVDSLTAAVKIVSDLTAEEMALGVRMVRERVTLRPAASVVGLGGRTLTGLIGAEKILLDLAAGETPLAVDGLKIGLRMPPGAAAIADLLPQGMETLIDTTKGFLDDTAEQAQELADSYAEGKPLMIAERMTKFAKRRVECFVKNQKKFLDQISEQVAIATEEGKGAAEPSPRGRWHDLMHIAREGVDKLMDAEKKMLHLAITHIESPMPPERAKPPRRTSLAEMTRESVQNITAAQKSLLDVAAKPIMGTATTAPRPKKAARPRKRAKV